ncbi:hypothetical protein AAHE18_13G097200 [Arachis hypogaea]
MMEILACSHQSKATQELFLSDFLQTVKVGDVGHILDLMAVVLENISISTLLARTTISAVYQTAKLISYVPNVSYQKKLDQKTKMAMKVQSNSFHIQHDSFSEVEHLNGKLLEGNTVARVTGDKNDVHPYRGYSFTRALTDGKEDLGSLRLSSHQVSLLLSSIWVQATSVENSPANFEAMAHTFSISLLFTRSKWHMVGLHQRWKGGFPHQFQGT